MLGLSPAVSIANTDKRLTQAASLVRRVVAIVLFTKRGGTNGQKNKLFLPRVGDTLMHARCNQHDVAGAHIPRLISTQPNAPTAFQ